MHDLSQIVSGEFCCRMNEILEDSERLAEIGRARHSSCSHELYEHSKKFEVLHKMRSLRAFLPTPVPGDVAYISINVLYELLPELKLLRVLSLSGCLPASMT